MYATARLRFHHERHKKYTRRVRVAIFALCPVPEVWFAGCGGDHCRRENKQSNNACFHLSMFCMNGSGLVGQDTWMRFSFSFLIYTENLSSRLIAAHVTAGILAVLVWL